jgi:hypothetical protein
MIRAKGGERRPAFLVDQANAVRGTAVLASASADEAAQESDRVGRRSSRTRCSPGCGARPT